MRKLAFWIAAVAFIVLQIPDANADLLFNWSYSDGGSNVGGGTLTATPDLVLGGAAYDVTTISGTANGLTITGLDSYDFADNVVFYYASPPVGVAVDSLGISFGVGLAGSFNLYEDDGLFATIPPAPPNFYDCAPGAIYCLLGPGTAGYGDSLAQVGVAPLTLVATAVPEPASLALLGSALFGFAAIRRRRKAV